MLTAVCVAVAMIGLAAQDQAASSANRDQSASRDQNTITLTGCLAKGDSLGATGTTGTTPPASRTTTSGQFVLNNAKMGSATSTTAAPGGTTAGAAGTSGSSYILDGPESDFTRHVGHKVEITGTIDKSASSTPPSATATAPGGSMAAKEHVKVSAVKMISASCTDQ
jgi:hypothetical protein